VVPAAAARGCDGWASVLWLALAAWPGFRRPVLCGDWGGSMVCEEGVALLA